MSDTSQIIELTGISKHFGPFVGVEHIDLNIKDGEFLTLLGPSGCGKSTLLRMIGGFETPTTGTIRIAGKDVTNAPPQKRDVNMMFQDYALFPHMSIGKNIGYGLQMKGIKGPAARKKVLDALELVGLTDKIDQYPSQLSGGQRQRIALARAIVREPKVLLLDEPLSALDAKLREQMQVELKHMHQKLGITFIMVTHDQTEALVMSDRVVVMQKGRIAQDGTPEDLYEKPQTPYVANFIGTTNFLPAKFISKDGNETIVDISGQSLTIADVNPNAANRDLQVGIRPEKLRFVLNSEAAGKNTLKAQVTETIYLGLGLRTLLRLENGEELMVDTMLPQGIKHSTHPQRGDDVRVTVEPHNVFLFSEGV